MLVGHRIEYRRIPDRFLDRPVEFRRQTELRQHTVVDAVDLRLAVDLVGIILVHDRKSRRTGERIFAPPLVEQPVRIETAALDGQRTQIAVHETPRRPRRIGSRREERRRRIVIDDPQMPAPQDRAGGIAHGDDGVALFDRRPIDLEGEPQIANQSHIGDQTRRILPYQTGIGRRVLAAYPRMRDRGAAVIMERRKRIQTRE